MQYDEQKMLEKAARLTRTLRDSISSLVKKVNDHTGLKTEQAIYFMKHRMIECLNSVTILSDREITNTYDYRRDAACILRAQYDLHLQCLYLLTDVANLSPLYLNYQHVHRFRLLQLFDNHTDQVVVAMKINDPTWASERASAESDYKKVEQDYFTKSKKVRDHWYKGTLADLAIAVGRESEYRMIHMMLSSVIHSDVATVAFFTMKPQQASYHACQFTMRVMGAIAEYLKIPMSEDEQIAWDAAKKPVYGKK